MASNSILPSSPLAHPYPEDLRQHAAALMEEFDAVMLAMDKVSQGVTEGVPQTVEYLAGDTTIEVQVKRLAQNLTRYQSNLLFEVLPRGIFDCLYQSFSQLNSKLAARANINLTPECHDSGHALDYGSISCPSPQKSAAPHSLGHSSFCNDLHGDLEPSEGQIEDMVDRCCVCFTLASEEELMTTPCCLRAVGSICFEEALQETGKCCLCQAPQPKSHSQSSAALSHSASQCKIHSVPESRWDRMKNKAEVGTASTGLFEQTSSLSTGSAIADDSLGFLDASESLVANATKKNETEVLKLSSFKLSTLVPSFLAPYLPQLSATQHGREPVENAQYKTLDPSAQVSATVSKSRDESHVSAGLDKGKHQITAQADHKVTKNHTLKLSDQDVICHLTGVHEEHLLSLVQSALRECRNHTACKGFFQRAQVLEERYVNLSICLKCSQDPDLLIRVRDWPWVFESFVLTTQLQSYKVSMDNIQIGTLSILRGFEKSKTIQMLLNDNGSVLKSLKSPADVRGINWSRNITDLKPFEYISVTIKFSTAQQANEAIEDGLIWHHERRRCRRQRPRPKITQCRDCQAYGHVSKDCSSAPRCHTCAGMHLSNACIVDPTADRESLRCALCGGAHNAMDENCESRKAERQRLRLKNRFYPTVL